MALVPDRLAARQVAQVMTALGTRNLPAKLAALLRDIAPFSYFVGFAYRGATRPIAMFDDFPEDKWQVFVGEYQAGPYLLDPFYLACAQPQTNGLFRIKDLAPDRFYQGEYFRNYYVQTGLSEEIGYFVDLPGEVKVVVSLMRAERAFTGREFGALQSAFPVIEAAIQIQWPDLAQSFLEDQDKQKAQQQKNDLGKAFANFGQATLTPREREVVEYTLKGHSAEAAGLILNIAPGTVRIHRRNIYMKLGISSQGELFARFIATLGSS